MPRKKICVSCKLVCYSKNSIKPVCKKCIGKKSTDSIREKKRFWYTRKKYNIDELDFECLWIAFKGKCAICDINMTLPTKTKGQNLTSVCIDHDHKTGKVRGLLCAACNKALGLFKDNITSLNKAMRYLNGT